MGDTAAPADPIVTLIAQVNRFTGPSAPAAYRMADAPYMLDSGNLSAAAMSAVVLYQRAATDSFTKFGDRGSQDAITKANTGFADPAGFVTANLAEVTNAIAGLGDSLKLPAAMGPDGHQLNSGASTETILLIAGVGVAAVALWLFARK